MSTFKFNSRQLHRDVNKLEEDRSGLVEQEEGLRILLGRLAREGEEDLAAAKKINVILQINF